jgi:DNA gyrase subunit B
MERDLGAEFDQMKEELQQMKKLLMRSHLPMTEPKTPPGSKEVLPPESRVKLNELRDQLLAYTEAQKESGAIAYTGTFCSGEDEATRQSIWVSVVPTDELLKLNENRMVEKVLSSIGNSQRLAIVLALLKKPMTVNQLMEVLGSNTTGQVYHHLKPLVAADLIQEEKGVYAVIPYRVQGMVMLLAAVWDLIDTRYTAGVWEEQGG